MAVTTVCKAEIWTTSLMKIDDSMVISKFALKGRPKVILGGLGETSVNHKDTFKVGNLTIILLTLVTQGSV